MRIAWLSIALAACGGNKSVEPKANRPNAPVSCVSPLQFGAIANDGQDDRVAIQAAIDAAGAHGGTVCLPAGDLHVGRHFGKIPSLVFANTGVTMKGEGATSRLVMLAKPDDENGRDWWVIQLSGKNNVLRDFAMEGSQRGVTDEQTHLIQVRGPAEHLLIEKLHLAMPPQTISRGGDCIRLLGDPGELVRDVTIRGVHGAVCARSFIAFQRLVSKVLVERVTSSEVGGQAIDMEPSGDGAIEDVIIRRSTFKRGAIAKGGVTVAFAGSRAASTKNVVIEDSEVDGGIQVFRVHGARIHYNHIYGGTTDKPMIRVHQDSRDIHIESNIIKRQRGIGGGIEMFSHNDGWPRDIVIRNNEISMETEGFAIHGEPVQDVEIANNTITCKSSRHDAVFLRGVKVAITGARVHHNHIRGNCAAAVRIGAHLKNVTGATVVEDNLVEGARFGVLFENGAPSVRPIVNRNVFSGVGPDNQVRGSERQGFAGSNKD